MTEPRSPQSNGDARFERAIAASDEGLFERVIDEDAMFLSDRVYELLGWPPGGFPATRSALMALCHPDDLGPYIERSMQALRAEASLDTQVRLRHRSGEWRWYRQRSRLERQPDGRLIATGVIADVHEQTLARQELERHRNHLQALVAERTASLETALALAEQRRREAEAAAAARSQFLAHMSHEIRTPLNGALGLTELALRAATTAPQRRWLELALQSGQTLQRLIDQVLDFSRLEAGHLALDPQPFDLPQALAHTLRSVMPLVRQPGLMVLFDWVGELRELVGDETRILQIVTNLLGNALKFTDQGHVTLSGEALDRGDGHAEVRIQVADSGPGIPAHRREEVFQPFIQGERDLSRPQAGTGLGLAISRTLARAMGAELTLDGPAGGGTVFTLKLTLPIARAAQPVAPLQGLAWVVHGQAAAGTWVLQRLQRLGLGGEVFTRLEDAIERALTLPPEGHPRLLLLAARLLRPAFPLERLREALPRTRLVLNVWPDWDDADTEARARSLGLLIRVTPLTQSELRALLAPEAGPPAADAAVADEAAPGAARPDVLLVEDNAVNQLIGMEFLRVLGEPLRCVGDGRQAVDACLAQPPGLVLMDVQMPVLDGLQATRELRALQAAGRLPAFPIVALTAFAGPADRAACLDAGMDDFLTKPLALEDLRAALARHLKPAA